MRKLYYRLGMLIGISGSGIGLTGLLRTFKYLPEYYIWRIITYALCIFVGMVVIFVTSWSRRKPRLRYYSKQFQVTVLYLTGTITLLYTENPGGFMLFIIGLMLAYRFSFLYRMTLLWTLIYNWGLILTAAFMYGYRISSVVDSLVFIGFVYLVIYMVYSEYYSFFKKRIKRLNTELDLARQIIPFGPELKKKLRAEGKTKSDFTGKEYEVMVAMCIHEKLTNDELADFLNISTATVKTHLNNIYRKTGIHNRSRLIAVYRDLLLERRKQGPVKILYFSSR